MLKKDLQKLFAGKGSLCRVCVQADGIAIGGACAGCCSLCDDTESCTRKNVECVVANPINCRAFMGWSGYKPYDTDEFTIVILDEDGATVDPPTPEEDDDRHLQPKPKDDEVMT